MGYNSVADIIGISSFI